MAISTSKHELGFQSERNNINATIWCVWELIRVITQDNNAMAGNPTAKNLKYFEKYSNLDEEKN